MARKEKETEEREAVKTEQTESHLDQEWLQGMEDGDIEKLARDMGIDTAAYADRDAMIAAIAEVPVTPGPEDPETDQEPERDVLAGITNPCVYCGPTVRGVARQYTTYQGGIPEPLKEFIRAHPAARSLVIPTSRFAAMRKRLETPGTAEAIVYKKIKAEL